MAEEAKPVETSQEAVARRFDPKLLERLVCPLTRTSLEYDAKGQRLISRAARLAYPIRDGTPYLSREEAVPLED
jgi:hypothetical protein